MRFVWAVVVGVIGCGATYVAATRLGAVGQMILGPTAGTILGLIVAGGGVAVTIALAVAAARPRTKAPSGP